MNRFGIYDKNREFADERAHEALLTVKTLHAEHHWEHKSNHEHVKFVKVFYQCTARIDKLREFHFQTQSSIMNERPFESHPSVAPTLTQHR